MKKKFIQSSILLLIGGFLTKVLGMLIKIIMSRTIGLECLSIYMLILPTFSFCMMLGQAGFSLPLTRMVAYQEDSLFSLYDTVYSFLLVYNLIISILLICIAPFISSYLLKNESLYLPIIGVAFVIPFTTLSNTLKSYYIGKQRIFPTVLSNVVESILRLLFIIMIIPYFLNYSTSYLVFFMILFNIVSESISFFILYLFLPIKKHVFSFQFSLLIKVLRSSFPHFIGTLIGNITYFLEPVLFFHLLSHSYSYSSLTQEYGVITGYVYPLLFLPSFFIITFSQALLPTITQLYKDHNYSRITSIFKYQSIMIFLFSILMGIIFYLYAGILLSFVYHTNRGISYIQFLSLFLFFLYIESIFPYYWMAMDQTKEIFHMSIFSSFIRVSSFILFALLKIGIYSFLLSFLMNIVLTSIYQFIMIVNFLKKKENCFSF